jgi:hypothetical protein
VVLGDSQTHGNNASREKAWPQQLAAYTGSSTYQMAYGGWGPPQYRALVDDALALKPKIVIVALYAGNDLLDSVRFVYALDY